jgi:predicted nucleotide-binding protein
MYYQILIETTEKIDESDVNKQYFELDRSSLDDIETNIVLPYLRKEEFIFSGKILKFIEIKRILIKESIKTTHELSLEESSRISDSAISVTALDILNYKEHLKDITTTVFNKALLVVLAKQTVPTQSFITKPNDQANVLLVHGRDHLARDIAVNFLEKIGITTILLHEHMRGEKTIIEKLEENLNIGYAIVLYTPTGLELKPRAKQHIVFEHGYLTAKLGRRKVCALIKSNVETPLQCKGVIYVPLDALHAWQQTLANELTRAGYQINFQTLSI